jgi:hypothetical protein
MFDGCERASEGHELKEKFGTACVGTVLEHAMYTLLMPAWMTYVELFEWRRRRAFLRVNGKMVQDKLNQWGLARFTISSGYYAT